LGADPYRLGDDWNLGFARPNYVPNLIFVHVVQQSQLFCGVYVGVFAGLQRW
jgi:hypothetical protein